MKPFYAITIPDTHKVTAGGVLYTGSYNDCRTIRADAINRGVGCSGITRLIVY